MRITENQLRRIVKSIISEGAETETHFKYFEEENPDYTKPDDIAYAFKLAMERRKGGTNNNHQKLIEDMHDSLKNSLDSMTKNYAAQLNRGAPDTQKTAKQDIQDKVKSYIEKTLSKLSA